MTTPNANDETRDLEGHLPLARTRDSEIETQSIGPDSLQLHPLQSAPNRIGQFELCQVIGTGSFGVVYEATDTVLERTVAIKIPRHIPDDDSKSMFLMEARAVASLEHPGIVPVYDAGESNGVCYLASAFCSGGNLASLVDSNACLSWQVIAEMMEKLALAMDHAHRRGVVHRDLKPANIVLAEPYDSEGDTAVPELRITDFGLARIVEMQQERTQSSQLVGTPCYMAPEQLGDNPKINVELADIYSLGVIMYELIAGRRPYESSSVVTVIDQIRHCTPTRPTQFRKDIPADLETIALKCMNEDPSLRYPDCQSLASELRRFREGRPIDGRRPTIVQSLVKWLRSPKRMTETGTLSIFIGVATPIWILTIVAFIAWENLEADMNAEMIPQTLSVCVGLLIPLIIIGYQVRSGNRNWLLPGLLISIFSLCLVAPPLFGNVYVFPKLYERYPLGRIIAYSLLTLEHAVQVIQYAILILLKRNHFSRREIGN